MWIESDTLPIDTDYKLPNNFRDEILRTIQQRFQISSHGYSLVNIQKTMDNHHFSWINPLFLWPFSSSQTVCFSVVQWTWKEIR